MDNYEENMGEKLAELRKQSNMSQEQLADELKISRQAISNWERNKAQPDIPTILRICGIFGVGLDDFIRSDKKMSKQSSKEGKNATKYDMAIGLFYAAGLFLGIGFFFVVGLAFNQPLVWGASLFGGLCLFLITGLLAHGFITLFRKDK